MTKKEMIMAIRGKSGDTDYFDRRLKQSTVKRAYEIYQNISHTQGKKYLEESLYIKERRLFWTQTLEEHTKAMKRIKERTANSVNCLTNADPCFNNKTETEMSKEDLKLLILMLQQEWSQIFVDMMKNEAKEEYGGSLVTISQDILELFEKIRRLN